MLLKCARLRALVLVIIMMVALTAVTISPFIQLDHSPRASSASMGHSVNTVSNAGYQSSVTKQIFLTVTYIWFADIILLLLLQFSLPRFHFDSTISIRLKILLLRPIKFTSIFLSVRSV